MGYLKVLWISLGLRLTDLGCILVHGFCYLGLRCLFCLTCILDCWFLCSVGLFRFVFVVSVCCFAV